MIRHVACCVWLWLLFALPAQAQPQLQLDDAVAHVELWPYVELLRDGSGSLSVDEVLAADARFTPLANSRGLNLGYTRDVVWLRLVLQSRLTRSTDWRLEIDYASLDHADLFEPLADGGLKHWRSGDAIAFSERALAHRNPVFPLHVLAGESRTFYLRAQSQGSLTLQSSLWRAAEFQTHSEAAYVAQALYFGILLALGLYNLMLFIALRDRVFLLYVALLAGFGVGMASLYGLGAQFLWPDSPAWNNRALPLGIAFSSLLAPLFTRAFLGTRRVAPAWHRLLAVCAWMQLGVLGVAMFGSVQAGVQAMSAAGIVSCCVMLACGVACAWRGVPGARLFAVAWGLFLLGSLLMALRNFGLIPTNAVTLYGMQIGSALEMLLLSFALAARFNQIRREKAQAQAEALAAQAQVLIAVQQNERELEQRVAERTEELAKANEQLRELAMHDPLTGLANRAALYAHLDHALHRARRNGAALALLMIDLDGFKAINDRLGHEAGDRVLVEVAERLNRCARGGDLLARLGGDEFVLVAEAGHDSDAATLIGERLLYVLQAPIVLGAERASVGASIGIAFGGDEPVDVNDLLRAADRAMYAAKAAGRGAVRIANRVAARVKV
ncbi:MAG: 7TM diverse intracellular signaling domain-containing protein [Pseudomarimonas sp.]